MYFNKQSPIYFCIWGFLFFNLQACTWPYTDQVHTRVNESLSGQFYLPPSIDPSGINQFSFSVFGDTHTGSPLGTVLQLALDKVKAQSDAFVVVAGDLTDYAKSDQFDEFKKVFSDNNITYRSAIGNHDIFFGGWSSYKNKIGSSVYSFDADNVHFSILDSANGTLGQRQLDWLNTDLKNTTKEHKIIITHYSPVTGEFMSFWRLSSDEESSILKTIAYKYNVDLVVAAHFHGFYEKRIGNTLYVVTGGVNKLMQIGYSRHFLQVTIDGSKISTQKISF